MSSERMQAAIKELQQAMALLADIERPQSGLFLDQSNELQRRIRKNLAEITEKLNRLIG